MKKPTCVCCSRRLGAMFPPSKNDPTVCHACDQQGLKAPKIVKAKKKPLKKKVNPLA